MKKKFIKSNTHKLCDNYKKLLNGKKVKDQLGLFVKYITQFLHFLLKYAINHKNIFLYLYIKYLFVRLSHSK